MIQAEAFEALASSSKGIVKLRELILELAVRGLLVPQDPNDEPASELLKRIQVEKAKLIAEGKIKKDKPLAAITENEKPFELPSGWEWTRMIDCAKQITDGEHLTPKRTADSTKIPLVTAKNVRNGNMDYANTDYVDFDVATKCWNRCKPEPNDILIVSVGATIGRLTIIDDHRDMVIVRSVTLVKPLLINIPYLALCLRSPFLQKSIWSGVKQNAQPCLYLSISNSLPIPLPPLAEQHRIVTKVDELMALCDQLEQHQNHSNTVHQRLLQTLLESLTQAADNEAFQKIWSQIAAHFDTLFTTEASIDQLKQVILQLAVIGKLVPQDPNDEPAIELIKRIDIEKNRLIHEGKIRKTKRLEPIEVSDIDFEIPSSWVAERLGVIYDVRDGTHDTPKYVNSGYPLITSKNLSSGKLSFDDIKFISEQDHLKISERSLVEKGDILLAMIGSIGNPVIVDTDRPFSIKNVALFKYYDSRASNPGYLCLFLKYAASEMQKLASGGIQPFVSLGFLRNFPFPLPPLAEQHRIVAKVDEFMAICDQLKSQINKSQQTQEHLATAIVEKAVA